MKGMAPFAIIVVALIFTVTIVGALMIPLIELKFQMHENIDIQTGYSNSQLMLLTLFSVTEGGQTLQEKIADHLVFNDPDNLDFVQEKIDLYFEDEGCYALFISDYVFESSDCSAKKYSTKTEIPLPYNPDRLTEEIEMVMS
jgi:hypothetical protein